MGRRPLSRERILATAIAMADRDGLDAVTLRRIARKLGVHVTSLYNHVPTKDAVIDGIVERLIVEAALPTVETTWQAWIRAFAVEMRSVAHRHPGAFAALERRPVQGPAATASFEVAIGAFRAAGFSIEDAFAAVKATSLAVLGLCIEETVASRFEDSATVWVPRTDTATLPPEDFPNMFATNDIADDVDAWTFLVESLIAGFSARLPSSRRPVHSAVRSKRASARHRT